MTSIADEFESPNYYFKLGDAALANGNPGEAISHFQQVLKLQPTRAEAYCKLGDAFSDLKEVREAVACYRRTLELDAGSVPAHYNLGVLLKDHRQFPEAAACFHQAVNLNPNFPEAHLNLGCALQELGKLAEATDEFRFALQLRPNWSEAFCNLGSALFHEGKFNEAKLCLKRAVELGPSFAEAHTNLSFVFLLNGDLEHGWKEYEWRLKMPQLQQRKYAGPDWNGEPLDGKTILLQAEQGLGDTIQFVRYASLLEGLGAKVLLECQPPLKKLLDSFPGSVRVVAEGDKLPPHDFQTPLLSLPLKFRTRLENVPCRVPYLSADPNLTAEWSKKLENLPGLRIGINWHGRHGRPESRLRDIPLENFGSLSQLPGVSVISLQKGSQPELAGASCHLGIVDVGEFDTDRGAFMDTAAIMKNLDLIVTSDTSVLHLAGALGVPVWLALPYVPNWRWLLDRSDSPWYPTMRLFRQKSPGDWAGVFDEIKTTLQEQLVTR